MKKLILPILLFIPILFIAQTNTFPTSGNVGIGTTTPQEQLEIIGKVKIKSGTASNHVLIDGGNLTGNLAVIETRFNSLSFVTNAGAGVPNINLLPDTGGNVGIGTSSPQEKLEIKGRIKIKSGTASNHVLIDGGNLTDNLAIIETRFNSLSIVTNAGAGVPNINLLPDTGGNVGIGTTTPDAKLAVNGTIHSKEVKVDLTGWPDFVFNTDYQLLTLKEVEAHIKEKGHLKDIPSAEEVAENGLLLGEMNAKLLQKIEELTLYTIQQEKKLEEQQLVISQMQKAISHPDSYREQKAISHPDSYREQKANSQQQKEIDELKKIVKQLITKQ